MPTKRFGAFSSSVNPQELSTTVEGVMKLIAGLLVYAGGQAVLPDVNTATTQIQAIILLGTQMLPLLYSMWNASVAAFGALRKIFIFFFDKFLQK